MPRPRLAARLYQRPDTGEWLIRDGPITKRTGAGHGQRAQAEAALAAYIASRTPDARTGPALASEMPIGEALARYVDGRGPAIRNRQTLAVCVTHLAGWWGDRTCDAVTGPTCRAYARARAVADSTVRRELGVLQAALNWCWAEGLLVHPQKVKLPPTGAPRERWLTRDEAARLLRAAPPHLQRFILIALASGRRASAICALRWTPALDAGHVDLERGVIDFRAGRETRKRRGQIRIPRGLAAHLRRWRREGGSHVIQWHGDPVRSIRKAFETARIAAELPDVSAHTLKHTAVTWAFQGGMTIEDAVDWFATSRQTLDQVYRQHSPHHQARAMSVIERRGRE